MDDSGREKQKEQVAKATQLQDLVLDDFITMAQEGTLTSTDRATVVRMLMANGWSLDPSQLPKNLRDKLTSAIRFDDDVDDTEARPRMRVV